MFYEDNMGANEHEEDLADFLGQQFEGDLDADLLGDAPPSEKRELGKGVVTQRNARVKRKLLKKSPDAPIRYVCLVSLSPFLLPSCFLNVVA